MNISIMNSTLNIIKKIYNFLIRCSLFSAYYFIFIFKKPVLNYKIANEISYTSVFSESFVNELKNYLLNLSISSFKPSIIFEKNNLNLKEFTTLNNLLTQKPDLYGELSLIKPETYGIFEKLIDKTIIEKLNKISNKNIYLNGINIRISFKSDNNIDHQYLFHRDRDSFEVIKYFIYLTDVDFEDGPFQFLENSYKQRFFEIFKHRYKNNYVDKYYNLKNLVNITGKKGTSFVGCTNSFHKQGENFNNYRIMITFKFGIQNWKQTENYHPYYKKSSEKFNYKLGITKK